ncbi:MAG: hypothetical protein KGM97_05620 [Alphaproteobacteria bacterium]|nr:hypothetical protein [Alphaproteobacteria bacterium]MDE2630452.1 hypothetical protein [Alphaproteobacteria bacterium]
MDRKASLNSAAAVAGMLILTATATKANADPFMIVFTQGKPLIDIRIRYEGVDQAGFAKGADALTLRARFGYQTGDWNGLNALFEFDQVSALGMDSFNNTRNGKTAFPVVADPSMTALNRLQITYNSDFDTVFTLGRQRIVFDNARFIGNVGWRQHEQTYDGISFVNKSLPNLALTYAYIDRVNRVFGPQTAAVAAQVGYFDGNVQLFNASYTGIDHLKLVGYTYLLDLANKGTSAALSKSLSTATYGLRGEFMGSLGDGVGAKLTGEYAHQTNYASNPGSFDLDYYLVEGSVNYKAVSGLIGYESLAGDGTRGFSTPLATLHSFNGWADQFLATPANGLTDLYVKAAYTFKEVSVLSQITAVVMYHDFKSERLNTGLGSEWDGSVDFEMDKYLSFELTYADYASSELAGTPVTKRIGWLSANYKY